MTENVSSHYELAQICMNGHVVTDTARDYPQRTSKVCRECGEATITTCPGCNSEIPGEYIVPGVYSAVSHFRKPAYCGSCGRAFPWTERALTALKEMAKEADELSAEDQKALGDSFEDVVAEGPRAALGLSRLRRLLPKVAKPTAEAMKRVLSDVVSEATKQQLGL